MSRVRISTNVKDCLEKLNILKKVINPLKIAADQLVKDGIEILHTIGGDDTNITAADLSNYFKTKQLQPYCSWATQNNR